MKLRTPIHASGEPRRGRLSKIAGFAIAVCAIALASSSAQAACDCLDTDGDGYPDRDGVCTGSTVTQTSPYPGEDPAQSNAQIQITFDRDLTCGQYINGDYWVVEPSPGAGVKIVDTFPKMQSSNDDGFGSRWKHGYQIDPVRLDAREEPRPEGQSFDQRVAYWIADGQLGRASTSSPFPRTVAAGSSFIKAHSKPVLGGTPKKTDGTSGCQGTGSDSSQTCIRAFMVLTVLSSAPAVPSDSFRPPYVARWDRNAQARDNSWEKPGTGSKKPYRYADVRFDALPKLDHSQVSSQSGYISNFRHIRDTFRLPQIEIAPHNQARRMRAYDSSSGGPLYSDGGDYAPRWAGVTNRAWLRFTGSDIRVKPGESGFNLMQKQAFVNLLQFGIDQLHMVRDGDKMYYADGGHYAGGYLPALMACHFFHRAGPVGYDVSPECAWLERNKAEGQTVDVGYPMWGEQTFVYRNPQGVSQEAMCAAMPARSGYTCAQLGIDPKASKTLYGQLFAQRAYTDAQKDAGGQGSCLGSWSGNVSTHCRDPYQIIDHPGNACNPDPDQVTKNYERIIQPNIREVALAARLFGAFQADGSGPFPNHMWDFTARRWFLGYDTQPDLAPNGGNPSGYTGGTNRCSGLHFKHACADSTSCYPTADEYGPVCRFCIGLLKQYPTFVHQPGEAPPPVKQLQPPTVLDD